MNNIILLGLIGYLLYDELIKKKVYAMRQKDPVPFTPQTAWGSSDEGAKWKTPPNGMIYEADFVRASQRYRLPAGLLSRVAYQESRYNKDARSPAGALGLMQIIPKWHPGIDPWNPTESIYYAAGLLRKYYNEFKSWPKALAAYNWGETNVRRKGIERLPRETAGYIADVTRDVGLG